MGAKRSLRAHRSQYRFDSNGNTRVTIDPTGMTEQRYDGLNRLVDTILPNPQTGLPAGSGTVNAYDGAGNLLSVTDPDYNVTRYGYDAENERTSQQVTIHDASGNPVTATTTWTYDSAGNLHRQVDADGRTIVYGYDALGRETNETWSQSKNHLRKTGTAPAPAELPPGGSRRRPRNVTSRNSRSRGRFRS